MHYNGIDAGIPDDRIVEMPEEVFRTVFGPGVPESLPSLLEAYSESQSGGAIE